MSFKRMVTKLALAFAAKKGVEAFRNVGGIDGLKAALGGEGPVGDARGGMHGRVGGARKGDAGGLGSILDSLAAGGALGGRESGVGGQISPLHGTLGSLFGSLAQAFGQPSGASASADNLDSQFDANDIASEREAKPIIRAMVQMARADGSLDDQEKKALFELMQDATPQEQSALQSALSEPVNPSAIAADTPAHARKEVYSAALLVGTPDKEAERDFLRALAHALGLSEAETEKLHRAMGKPVMA